MMIMSTAMLSPEGIDAFAFSPPVSTKTLVGSSTREKVRLQSSLTTPSNDIETSFYDDGDDTNRIGIDIDVKKKQHGRAKHIEIVKHRQEDEEEDADLDSSADEAPIVVNEIDDDAANKARVEEKDDDNDDSSKSRPHFMTQNPFTAYLMELKTTVKNPIYRAHRLDDELKRLESRYYHLMGDDIADCRYPYDPNDSYDGPVLKPPFVAYEIVCSAYADAPRMGQTGAWLAEDVVERYTKFHSSEFDKPPTNKMMTFVMRSWLKAKEIDRADVWLRRMEAKFESTNDIRDMPDPGAVYNSFLAALARKDGRMGPAFAARRSLDCIRTMNEYSKIFSNDARAYPSRSSYAAAMKCQKNSYEGATALRRVSGLFNHLKKNFKTNIEAGNIEAAMRKLKPTKHAAMHVMDAASNCEGKEAVDMKALKVAEDLIHDSYRLYKDTNDKDYRPHLPMYNTMFFMFSKVPPQQNPRSFAKRVFAIVDMMKEDNVTLVNPATVSSALNKVMISAERRIPEDPMADPVWTRILFKIVLDSFKKLHDGDVTTANASSYEIFLRVCNRLPDGTTKTQLATKAFELCRANGFVSQEVARQFQVAAPEKARQVFADVDQEPEKKIFNFPKEWTRQKEQNIN